MLDAGTVQNSRKYTRTKAKRVHNENEMKCAETMKSPLIGINNRNLNDFSVDIENSIRLSKSVPKNKVLIAESGIHTRADIEHIKNNSCIDTFLDLYDADLRNIRSCVSIIVHILFGRSRLIS